ncbi:YjfI family protein [Phenylobacterium sp.]|uniref:YjfI family protein n=1 Tax=Phenylobacterium sp. TaxID=1871053 RepID=UPI003982FDAF
MTESTPWTAESLKAALEASPLLTAGELTTRIMDGAEPVMVVVMRDFGDLEIFVSAGDQQIAASVLLWPVDEQEDRHAFNEFLLKAQKIVPLSNFGISTVGERDYYELFGELATTSSLDTIVIELRTLAQNAIEAASDLRTSFSAAA